MIKSKLDNKDVSGVLEEVGLLLEPKRGKSFQSEGLFQGSKNDRNLRRRHH
jgi:hypothetical protein